jgi:hypothetical protein
MFTPTVDESSSPVVAQATGFDAAAFLTASHHYATAHQHQTTLNRHSRV